MILDYYKNRNEETKKNKKIKLKIRSNFSLFLNSMLSFFPYLIIIVRKYNRIFIFDLSNIN